LKELAYLNKYFLKYKYHLLAGILCITLSNVFAIVPAQMVRHAIDMVSGAQEIYPLFEGFELQEEFYGEYGFMTLFYGGLIILMALIRGLFLFLMRQTTIVMSRLIEYDLKNEIYQHYQALPVSFYRKNNTGDLMARISEDVSKVRMYLGPGVMYSINLVVNFVLVIGYMLTVNVKLTFYALLPLPILSISIYYINTLINKRSEEIQRSLSQISTFVQEAFSGIRVIKAFAREGDSLSRFRVESEAYRDKSLRLTLVNSLFFPLMVGLIGISTILTVYVGGLEVIRGTITAGNIAEFIIYVNLLTWPVTALGWVSSIIQRAAASQKRINEFLSIQSDIVSLKDLRKPIKGNIAFENVSFRYADGKEDVLKKVSFEVGSGQSLAILGNTGSGKSTIANLICRLFDATEGRITIDGQDIRDYNIHHLRGHVGFVPQDVFLFSESIRNNIAFGFDNISEDRILEAAKNADLYNTLMDFPKGMDTVLGERGITLSGGQKQRVSIARAIIREPEILLLDDCLSAVDTKTENAILNSLKEIMTERTTIIISHRVSSAKLADKIILLGNGEILESGSHEELIKLNGSYKELYEKQLKAEQQEA